MNLYAYNAPGAKSAEANIERFRAYKESGLTTLYLTGNLSYCLNGNEPWESSLSKRCFDLANEVFNRFNFRVFAVNKVFHFVALVCA